MNNVTEWAKVIVVLAIIISATVLGFFQKLESEAIVGLLSAALGYVLGNAHGFMTASAKAKEASKSQDTGETVPHL